MVFSFKILLILICCTIFVFCDIVNGQMNNVCKNYLDYATLLVNPNCWYNQDVNSDTVDMINRNGYPAEEYPVETEDGHILSLYRIPHNNKTECSCRQPVYLQHGLRVTSEAWTNKKDRSLAFYLSDRCYDVWLGNFRGSPHSQTHIKYTTKDPQFWNHSWHEMGLYDLSANLNFIRGKVGDKCKILYVGQSMGTTSVMVYQILKPAEAKRNIEGLVLLSPVVFVKNVKSPLVLPTAPFWKQIEVVAHALNMYGVTKDHFKNEAFYSVTCSKFPLIFLCTFQLFLLSGFSVENLLPEDLPLIFPHVGTSTSFKSVNHYLQEVASGGDFRMYDYESRNVDVYGKERPPKYDVSKVILPTHLIYGTRDFIGVKQDVQRLFAEISSLDKSITELDYNHLDFLHSKDLKTNLYPIILEKLESMRCKKCP